MNRMLLALLLTAPASAQATTITRNFSGIAHPVSTSQCAQLPIPLRSAQGTYDYGHVRLATPLTLQNCWSGTLSGRPFSLAGFHNQDNDSGVVVTYRHQRHFIPIANGKPIVSAFLGTVVCYTPNPAKGVNYAIDIPTGRLLDPAKASCPAAGAFVKGLKGHYQVK